MLPCRVVLSAAMRYILPPVKFVLQNWMVCARGPGPQALLSCDHNRLGTHAPAVLAHVM
jgi:hypothetical protein